MAIIKTWQTDYAINRSYRLADAYGASLTPASPLPASNQWTATTLAQFGHRLTQGYGVGLGSP
jgi:hypothetical protein